MMQHGHGQGQRRQGRWIDAHLHVDLYAEDRRKKLLAEAFAAGVEAVVAVSMQLESCKQNRELFRLFPGRVMPAYGFHPEQPLPGGEQLDELFHWIRGRHEAGEAFAIGEVGLPYYSRHEADKRGEAFAEEPYLELLDRFAALAAELDRPIILHAVYEDADKALALLRRHRVGKAHFHWFKGSAETVQAMIDAGCLISVTPDVHYEEEIRQLVRTYPLELMMTETDGPWPFEGPYAGKETQPSMVSGVAAAVAELKDLSLEETERTLRANALEFYKLNG